MTTPHGADEGMTRPDNSWDGFWGPCCNCFQLFIYHRKLVPRSLDGPVCQSCFNPIFMSLIQQGITAYYPDLAAWGKVTANY